MSVSFTIGNFRDRADQQRQLDKYFKSLSLAAENLAKIKDIENGSITRSELKLAPVFSQRNSEDRLKDDSYQRQLAYQTLSTVFSITDTDAILAELMADSEIIMFNTYAGKFFDEFKINENTSISLFLLNWKLFQQKLNSNPDLGSTLKDIKSILETDNKAQTEILSGIQKTNELLKENGVDSKTANIVLNELKTATGDQLTNLNNSIVANGVYADRTVEILRDIQTEQKVQTNELHTVNMHLGSMRGLLQNIGLGTEATNQILTGLRQINEHHLSNIREQLINSRTSQTQANSLLNEIGGLLTDIKANNEAELENISNELVDAGITNSSRNDILRDIKENSSESLNLLRTGLRQAGLEIQEIKTILSNLGQSEPAQVAVSHTPASDYLDLVSLSTPEVTEIFVNHFQSVEQVPFVINGVRGNVDKSLVHKKDDMAKAIILSHDPNLVDDQFSFDTERVGRTSPIRGRPTEVLEQKIRDAITDVNEGHYDRARASIGSIDPSRLTADSRRIYNTISNTLRDVESVKTLPFRGNSGEDIETQTRNAKNLIVDLGDNKSSITRMFKNEFKNIADNQDVPTWNSRDNQMALIHKSAANAKYYKKIEAIVLKRFPLANLSGINISFSKSEENPQGEGISRMKIPKLKSIGRYEIHIPSLQKGYLFLQFPSKWRMKNFPKQAISSDMQELIWDLIDDKKFDLKKYKNLNAGEKRLYDEVIALTRISKNEIDGLNKHKSSVDVERDACLKKLKILYGEINSGNHSKKTIKDLKVLLLKMIHKNYISKKDSNKIIYQIALLDE